MMKEVSVTKLNGPVRVAVHIANKNEGYSQVWLVEDMDTGDLYEAERVVTNGPANTSPPGAAPWNAGPTLWVEFANAVLWNADRI